MKLVKASFEIVDQQPGIQGIMEQIEFAGRTCYKSEPVYEYLVGDKVFTQEEFNVVKGQIGEEVFVKRSKTAEAFVQRMMDSGHGAMLEHGTVYLSICYDETIRSSTPSKNKLSFYGENKYSKRKYITETNTFYITTNLRVLFENGLLDDLQYLCEPTEYHDRRVTTKFICDRGVSHEFVRHRVFSFAQESTRYCNYSKDKFDNALTFIIPNWLDISEGRFSVDYDTLQDEYDYSVENNKEYNIFLISLAEVNKNYLNLIDLGWKPQQARAVLPNSVKTELIMTGFTKDWKGFFQLRTPNSAHPQARELAIPLEKEFNESNLWTF